MKTFVREKEKVRLSKPALLGGFPGLGNVGKISITYLVRQLKAKKLADLYSPYLPHHVIVSSNGRVRLLRAQFYLWRNPEEGGRDLILLTSDSQAQGFEGQYDVVNKILEYAEQQGWFPSQHAPDIKPGWSTPGKEVRRAFGQEAAWGAAHSAKSS